LLIDLSDTNHTSKLISIT